VKGTFPTYLSGSVSGIGHLFQKISLSNPATVARKVVVHGALQGFTRDEGVLTVDLEPGAIKTIWLDAGLDYPALGKVSSPVDTQFSLKLTRTDGAVVFAMTRAVKVLPKNSVLWSGVFTISRETGTITREREAVVGVMTTPHDPGGAISQLLQEAATRHPRGLMSGYQGITDSLTREQASAMVADQSKAIFDTLYARGTNYTSVSRDFFDGAQNIRYPSESLRDRTANCIDGALVFTSAFEALGMAPAVVFVPGHAFVAVRLGPPGTSHHGYYHVLETTMISGGDFAAARSRASATWDTQAAKREVIDVATARKRGFLPFPL
jgi:hypothetical protein